MILKLRKAIINKLSFPFLFIYLNTVASLHPDIALLIGASTMYSLTYITTLETNIQVNMQAKPLNTCH